MHKYANEDVSLGAWLIGLEVEHIDDRNMCCGTPPGKFQLHFNFCFFHSSLHSDTCFLKMFSEFTDCEQKAQAGNVCVASFDWKCSGICRSVERIKDVHSKCGEGTAALWSVLL